MLKTILISSLAAILVIAIGFSAYNVWAGTQSSATLQQAATSQGAAFGSVEQGVSQETVSQVDATTQAETTPQVDSTAAAVNAANTNAATAPVLAQGANGQGAGAQSSGFRRGQSDAEGNSQNGTGVPQPQANITGLVTYSGVVSGYVAPEFTLITDDGQTILVQIGNQNYATSLGLALQDGDAVTVTGFIDSSGALAVTSITLTSTGQTYTLRESTTGRPIWAGGRNK